MRHLLPYMNSFNDELVKIAGLPRALENVLTHGKPAEASPLVRSRLKAHTIGREIGHDMRHATREGRKLTMEMDKANPWSRLHEAVEAKRQTKQASASRGALFGGMIGGGLTKGWRGALIGAGLGGAIGGAASLGRKLLEPSQGQLMAAQYRAWEPDGYVPSWQRAGF